MTKKRGDGHAPRRPSSELPDRGPQVEGTRRFERLLLTKRFAKAVESYAKEKAGRRAALFRVLHGLTTDLRTLQRSPLQNPKHRLFHTRVSKSDRLIDLPTGDGRNTLLLNVGDHSVNEWAQRYPADLDEEQGRVVGAWTEAASTDEQEDEGAVAAASRSPVETSVGQPGTYGEVLDAATLRSCGVPERLIRVVLRTSTRTSLQDLGLDESVDDKVVQAFCSRTDSRPLPIPVPSVRPRSEDDVVLTLSADQIPLLLQVPLHRYLAEMTEEQRRLVERPTGGLMVVKGAAGSGKTVVGVQRIVHLVRQSSGRLRVLFLCFNQVLRDLVK